MYDKIIVLLDGTEHAEAVLPHAKEIAQKTRSQLSIVGICVDGSCILERLLVKYLENLAGQLKSEGLRIEKTALLKGNHAEEILKYAGETQMNLIAMAYYSRLSSEDWPLGNMSDKILTQSKSKISLLLVPELNKANVPAKASLRKILVPLDGSDLGAVALPWAKELVKKTGAKLFLLQVLSSAYKTIGVMNYAAGFEKQLIKTMRKEADEYLSKAAVNLKKEGIDSKLDLVEGIPAEAILGYARSNSIDLIAISTHGRTGLSRFIMGSVAQKVVHYSEVPVLVIGGHSQSSTQS